MSRCRACDKLLTDAEACGKDTLTGSYIELCQYCRHESVDTAFDDILWREYKKDHKKSKRRGEASTVNVMSRADAEE